MMIMMMILALATGQVGMSSRIERAVRSCQ